MTHTHTTKQGVQVCHCELIFTDSDHCHFCGCEEFEGQCKQTYQAGEECDF